MESNSWFQNVKLPINLLNKVLTIKPGLQFYTESTYIIYEVYANRFGIIQMDFWPFNNLSIIQFPLIKRLIKWLSCIGGIRPSDLVLSSKNISTNDKVLNISWHGSKTQEASQIASPPGKFPPCWEIIANHVELHWYCLEIAATYLKLFYLKIPTLSWTNLHKESFHEGLNYASS